MRWGCTGRAQAAGEPRTSSTENGESELGPRVGGGEGGRGQGELQDCGRG